MCNRILFGVLALAAGLAGCNGEVETCGFRDADGDGHGKPGRLLEGDDCDAGGGVEVDDDCDDSDADISPSAEETPYDGIDNDCDEASPDDDLDGDGFFLDEDCDDTDADISPAAGEVEYDGIDNDCDEETRDDDLDEDGAPLADDCDDEDPEVHRGGTIVADLDIVSIERLCDASCEVGTTLDGSLTLRLDAVDSIDGLECIGAVEGDLDVGGGMLSLWGLLVERVGGDFVLSHSHSLWDLQSLFHLAQVDGSILVQGSGLQTLDGIGVVEQLGGDVIVTDNYELTSVEGLRELDAIGGDLIVRGNPWLSNQAVLEVANDIEVAGQVIVEGNGSATDFVDPGFEQSGIAGHWTTWLRYPGFGTFEEIVPSGSLVPGGSQQVFTARSGGYALRTTGWYTNPPPFGTLTVYEQRHGGFAVGDRFDLGGYVFVPSGDPIQDDCVAYLVIKFFGESTGHFLGLEASPVVNAQSPTDQWLARSLSATVPVGTGIVQVGVEHTVGVQGCGGSAYWDDLWLDKQSP